jgi:hypothetical protein
LSAIVAHTGWHWMIDRADRLREFRFEWPVIDIAVLAATARVLLVVVLVAGLVWAARAALRADFGGRPWSRRLPRSLRPSSGSTLD